MIARVVDLTKPGKGKAYETLKQLDAEWDRLLNEGKTDEAQKVLSRMHSLAGYAPVNSDGAVVERKGAN